MPAISKPVLQRAYPIHALQYRTHTSHLRMCQFTFTRHINCYAFKLRMLPNIPLGYAPLALGSTLISSTKPFSMACNILKPEMP